MGNFFEGYKAGGLGVSHEITLNGVWESKIFVLGDC
jgi:hypothetical protein